MDGDVDYSKYSRSQLEEALGNIDERRFPKNYANITAALAVAPAENQKEALPPPRRWDRILGWYLISAAVVDANVITSTGVLSHSGDFEAIFNAHPTSLVYVIVAVLLVTLVASAGVLLVREHRMAIPVAVASFATQLVGFENSSFAYKFHPLLSVYAQWGDGIGINGELAPAIKLSLSAPRTPHVEFDILAAAAIILLLRARRSLLLTKIGAGRDG